MLFLLLAAGARAASGAAAPPPGDAEEPPPPTPWEVYLVLEKHCAECHGGHLAKPKGKFGFILDLRRLVSEAYIRPGLPEKSDLYTALIVEDPDVRMPPPDSDGPKPTNADIDLIRRWIAAGAWVDAAPAAAAAETSAGAPAKPRESLSIGRLLGRLHPLLVHFPIAMLLAGAAGHAASRLRPGNAWLPGMVRGCLWIGAAGAVAAAGCGWLAASHEGFSGITVERHRWLGVSTTLAALVALGANEWFLRTRARSTRLVLLAAVLAVAVLVALAGHTGGLLAYGEDYFGKP